MDRVDLERGRRAFHVRVVDANYLRQVTGPSGTDSNFRGPSPGPSTPCRDLRGPDPIPRVRPPVVHPAGRPAFPWGPAAIASVRPMKPSGVREPGSPAPTARGRATPSGSP